MNPKKLEETSIMDKGIVYETSGYGYMWIMFRLILLTVLIVNRAEQLC